MPFTRPRHWLRWLLAAIGALVVLAAAGPFIYIHFFNSAPAALSLPPASTPASASAHGNLTLHGTTRAVTFALTAERKGAQIEVAGDIPVLFADYNIQNPSFAGFVTTQDHGLLEFLLVFSKT